jgi:two-component system cell cycle sensor histidine kinase/response regulator CckA
MADKLLIVDDELEVLETLDLVLKQEGYDVTVAQGGEEALEYLTSNIFDLIITDIQMPDIGGIKLIQKARAMDKDLAIIILTGFAEIKDAIRAFKDCSIFDYLTKPLEDLDAFLFSVNKALENKKMKLKTRQLLGKLAKHKVQLEQQCKTLHQTQRQLETSKSLYSDLYDSCPVGYFVFDRDGVILNINIAGVNLLGKDINSLLGNKITQFICQRYQNVFDSHRKQVFSNKGKAECELKLKRKDGSELYVRLNSMAVSDDKDQFIKFRSMISDVTERKLFQAQLQQSQKLKSIGLLGGGIAHDFNNLLSVIMGNIELANLYVKPEDEIFHYLQIAHETSLKAKELTNLLVTFSTGGDPVKRNGSIENTIKESMLCFKNSSKIKIKLSFSRDLWPVKFDGSQMQYAVKNMISNSIEAMSECGTIEINVTNHTDQNNKTANWPSLKGKHIQICIKDHGIGIPKKHLNKIFDPYFTTKSLGTLKGMGMGLAITYSVINHHGGQICVASEKDVGTTFMMYLPVEKNLEPKLRRVLPSLSKKKKSQTNSILFIDHEKMLRDLALAALNVTGYQVNVAKDVGQAISFYIKAMAEENLFDAVILDLSINEVPDEKSVFKKILELDPNARVIVSSGYFNDPVMMNFKEHGFVAKLPKPYNLNELNTILQQVLAG